MHQIHHGTMYDPVILIDGAYNPGLLLGMMGTISFVLTDSKSLILILPIIHQQLLILQIKVLFYIYFLLNSQHGLLIGHLIGYSAQEFILFCSILSLEYKFQ